MAGTAAAVAALGSAVIWGLHITAGETPVPMHAKPVQSVPAGPLNTPATALLFGSGRVVATDSGINVEGIRLHGIVTDRGGASEIGRAHV